MALPEQDNTRDWKHYRAERYRLQSVARTWLLEEGKKQGLQHPENYHKTAKCFFTRCKINVEIAKMQKCKKKMQAFYRGLVKCARIWTCPVCAAKIQAVRRKEVHRLVEWAYGAGYTWQIAGDLMKRFSKALAYLRGGRQWQLVKKELQFVGLVRGLEVLRGGNGWHIHTHELWVVGKKIDVSWISLVLPNRWEEAVEREGLLPEDRIMDFRQHGVDLVNNVHSSDYLAKSSWGVDAEVTTVHRKNGGKKGGVGPFELIREGRREEYLEYVIAFHGRAQLFWSRGLKDKAAIKEVKDEEAVGEEKIDILGVLTPEEWRIVVCRGARVEILELAEQEGILGIREWLELSGVT